MPRPPVKLQVRLGRALRRTPRSRGVLAGSLRSCGRCAPHVDGEDRAWRVQRDAGDARATRRRAWVDGGRTAGGGRARGAPVPRGFGRRASGELIGGGAAPPELAPPTGGQARNDLERRVRGTGRAVRDPAFWAGRATTTAHLVRCASHDEAGLRKRGPERSPGGHWGHSAAPAARTAFAEFARPNAYGGAGSGVAVSARVRRLLREQEVAGSNPVAPTIRVASPELLSRNARETGSLVRFVLCPPGFTGARRMRRRRGDVVSETHPPLPEVRERAALVAPAPPGLGSEPSPGSSPERYGPGTHPLGSTHREARGTVTDHFPRLVTRDAAPPGSEPGPSAPRWRVTHERRTAPRRALTVPERGGARSRSPPGARRPR